jgi:long-chain acyl-CoA synthetase
MDYRSLPNLPHMLFDVAAHQGARPALWAKRHKEWHALSWAEVARQVNLLARGLQALGIGPGDRVAIIAENRPEWIIADHAVMAAGAISVPAYTTNTVVDHRFILTNTGAKLAIVSTAALGQKVLAAASGTTHCKTIIAIEKLPPEQNIGVTILSWDDALARGQAAPDNIKDIVGKLTRRDTACIIHTSGTGGVPKGVTLTHGAILCNSLGARDLLLELGLEDEVFLSFLPLSHSYEHTVIVGFALSIGAQIYFAESVEALPRNITEVHPTIMTAVPRLYESMHARITANVAREGGFKAKLFARAVALGIQRYERPESMGLWDKIVDAVVDRLVRSKVRERFGGRLKAFVSGGAPLQYEIGLFFTALGVRLLQGYGQTETAPVVSCNPPRKVKLDTVGPPLTDVEVKIAEDGEILVRGELIMTGYWNEPEATANAIRDGWLHTGDVGFIDNEGYIKITDRKKDFIKNTGGDMVAPARIEGLLVLQPEIAQAMVYGDRRPHLVGLIVPDPDFVKSFAASRGKPAEVEALLQEKEFVAAIDKVVARVNSQLTGPERVRKFLLAREAFSLQNEQMTPTLKIRRHKIREAYGAQLDALYG